MSDPTAVGADPGNVAATAAACDDRAAAFLFVHDLARRPDQAGWEWLHASEARAFEGRLRDALGLAEPPGNSLPDDRVDYEAQFITTFEAGLPHPPVPLIESHYHPGRPAPEVIHENILYYRVFGLRLRDSAVEAPDHLRCQLELVAHLYNLEAQELRAGADSDRLEQLRCGRSDFVARHLLSWLATACARAAACPEPWVSARLELARVLAETAIPTPRRGQRARG